MKIIKYSLLTIVLFVSVALIFAYLSPRIKMITENVAIQTTLQDNQIRIVRSFRASASIYKVLNDALKEEPSAARIRVALIHKASTAAADAPLQFDVTHVSAPPFGNPGELYTNVPLAQWNSYLDRFLNGKCAFLHTTDPQISPDALVRLKILKAAAFIGCPLINDQRQLLGAVFFSWDDVEKIPTDISNSEKILRNVVTEILPLISQL